MPDSIQVTIIRNGVPTLLSSCRLDTPEERERQGLILNWVEPNPIGFSTLTVEERADLRRLMAVGVDYCDGGVGEVIPGQ